MGESESWHDVEREDAVEWRKTILLMVLEVTYGNNVSERFKRKVQRQTDPVLLRSWRFASTAATWADYLVAVDAIG
jgi:hypothetical protein